MQLQSIGPYYKIVMKSSSILKAPFSELSSKAELYREKMTHPPEGLKSSHENFMKFKSD